MAIYLTDVAVLVAGTSVGDYDISVSGTMDHGGTRQHTQLIKSRLTNGMTGEPMSLHQPCHYLLNCSEFNVDM